MLDVFINVLIVCGIFLAICITLWLSISIVVFMVDSFRTYFKKDEADDKNKVIDKDSELR